MKPICHECKHSKSIPGDAHIQCVHPKISEIDRLMSVMFLLNERQDAPVMKRLNVSGDRYGIRSGWFMWPMNFDPTWLLTCDGFEKKGGDEHETK